MNYAVNNSVKTISIIFFLLAIICCGVPEEQYNALKDENAGLQSKVNELSNELNDLKFGADALLKKAKLKIDDKDYEGAKEILTSIVDKYYSSQEAVTAKKLITAIDPKIEESAFNKARTDSGTALLESYISQYPDGQFINTANYLLEERSWKAAVTSSSKTEVQNFINKYPESRYLADARELIIKYEVNEVFKTGNYNQLPPLTKDYNAYSESYSDNSSISIKNNTAYSLTLLYSGPEQRKITISRYETESVLLRNGAYRIVAYVDAPNVTNYAGEEQLNGQYTSSYYISSSNGYRSYSGSSNYNYEPSPSTSTNYNWKSTSSPSYTPRSDYPVYQTRVGAVCCDGSRSYATGSGACSHHGGVCQWLYE